MDTTVNPTTSTATVATKPMRVKHALAFAVCQGTASGVRIIDSTADVVSAVATRVKLHNVATAADLLEEYGSENVAQAQQLIKGL